MDFEAIKKAAEGYKPAMVKFLRDMIAIPSESCEEEGVVKRIAEEMKALGYDKVEFDKLGYVIGWMGSGASPIVTSLWYSFFGVVVYSAMTWLLRKLPGMKKIL